MAVGSGADGQGKRKSKGLAFFRLRNKRGGARIKRVAIDAEGEAAPASTRVFEDPLTPPLEAEGSGEPFEKGYEVDVPHDLITRIRIEVVFEDAGGVEHEVSKDLAGLQVSGGLASGYITLLDDAPPPPPPPPPPPGGNPREYRIGIDDPPDLEYPLDVRFSWPEAFPLFVCPGQCGP